MICEISVLDSTADGSSGVKYPGKYLGLAEKGTKNKEGEATGLDYLKSLGITHVQIMPMYDLQVLMRRHQRSGSITGDTIR